MDAEKRQEGLGEYTEIDFFFVCWFVGWLVCQQDSTKSTERISTKNSDGGWISAQNTPH